MDHLCESQAALHEATGPGLRPIGAPAARAAGAPAHAPAPAGRRAVWRPYESHDPTRRMLPGDDIEAELDAVEVELGVRLPVAYRGFLMTAHTHPVAAFARKMHRALRQLGANREYADYLLKVSKAEYALDASDIVFLFHESHQFLFFRASTSDDPPICRFREGELRPHEVAPSFSAWLGLTPG